MVKAHLLTTPWNVLAGAMLETCYLFGEKLLLLCLLDDITFSIIAKQHSEFRFSAI